MTKLLSLLIAGACLLAGCAQPVKPKMTSLEIQAYQAKTFEADKKITFNAVMSVLQDLGYIIGSASLDTGFITAVSPNKSVNSPAAQLAKMFGGIITEGNTAVTVSIEEITPKRTRVRLNFVDRQTRSGNYGQRGAEDTPVEDQQVYVNAFDKIGEAIFIRQAQNSSTTQPSKATK